MIDGAKIGGAWPRTLAIFAILTALVMVTACERSGEGARSASNGGADDQPAANPALPLLSDVADTVPPPPPKPVKMEPVVVVNKDAIVSILGYHDFTDGSRRTSEMVMLGDDFRVQMQSVKDSEIPVISMQDYLAWKRGEKPIPDPSIMITIDDGWKATHTVAMPILKEFGFPFTIFLYKKYVGIGGRSLTYQEVRELMAAGAAVGSHSVSHISMINRGRRSDEEYDEWLRVELEESFDFLKTNFGNDGEVIKVFAYPFGIYSDYVVEKAKSYGYEAGFTVNGSKAAWDTPPLEVGRYIVYGSGDQNFGPSMTFRGGGVLSSGNKLLQASEGDAKGKAGEEGGEPARGPLVTTYPKSGEVITDRRPVIHLDLSKLEGVEADSIVMRVSGFGVVHHSYDEGAGIIRYQVPMALRNQNCGVAVRFRHAGNEDTEEIGWNFTLDRMKSYLESIDSTLLTDEADEKKAKDKAPKANDQAAVARSDSSASKAAAVSNK